jgi:hypothetical protein
MDEVVTVLALLTAILNAVAVVCVVRRWRWH